ncbi:MAG: GLUG motif-containing protein [Candidatus Saliniplasma sp.]
MKGNIERCLTVSVVLLLVIGLFAAAVGSAGSLDEGGLEGSSLEYRSISADDPIEIYDWHDLNGTRNDLSADYVLMNDLDEDTEGYTDYNAQTEDYESEENVEYGETWDEGDMIDIPFEEEDYNSVLSVEDEDGNAINHTVDHPTITIDEDTGERYIYVIYENAVIGWKPIGDSEHGDRNQVPFTGTFDGNGYEIRDLYNNRPNEWRVGLFGAIDNRAEIVGLGIVDADASGETRVGGLVGQNDGTAKIENCYATGDISGGGNVGGLVGVNDEGTFTEGTVENSYATGNVRGKEQVGGLVGYNFGTVENSFWDIETSGIEDSDGGTGLTTDEMIQKETFTDADWDFDGNWDILEGETYPFLQWQEEDTYPYQEEPGEDEDDGIPGFTTALLLLASIIAVAIYQKKSRK